MEDNHVSDEPLTRRLIVFCESRPEGFEQPAALLEQLIRDALPEIAPEAVRVERDLSMGAQLFLVVSVVAPEPTLQRLSEVLSRRGLRTMDADRSVRATSAEPTVTPDGPFADDQPETPRCQRQPDSAGNAHGPDDAESGECDHG